MKTQYRLRANHSVTCEAEKEGAVMNGNIWYQILGPDADERSGRVWISAAGFEAMWEPVPEEPERPAERPVEDEIDRFLNLPDGTVVPFGQRLREADSLLRRASETIRGLRVERRLDRAAASDMAKRITNLKMQVDEARRGRDAALECAENAGKVLRSEIGALRAKCDAWRQGVYEAERRTGVLGLSPSRDDCDLLHRQIDELVAEKDGLTKELHLSKASEKAAVLSFEKLNELYKAWVRGFNEAERRAGLSTVAVDPSSCFFLHEKIDEIKRQNADLNTQCESRCESWRALALNLKRVAAKLDRVKSERDAAVASLRETKEATAPKVSTEPECRPSEADMMEKPKKGQEPVDEVSRLLAEDQHRQWAKAQQAAEQATTVEDQLERAANLPPCGDWWIGLDRQLLLRNAAEVIRSLRAEAQVHGVIKAKNQQLQDENNRLNRVNISLQRQHLDLLRQRESRFTKTTVTFRGFPVWVEGNDAVAQAFRQIVTGIIVNSGQFDTYLTVS